MDDEALFKELFEDEMNVPASETPATAVKDLENDLLVAETINASIVAVEDTPVVAVAETQDGATAAAEKNESVEDKHHESECRQN